MEKLEMRTDIAKAINFHEYPTVTIDIAKADEYGLKSEKVLIEHNGRYIRSEIRAFIDKKRWEFHSRDIACLKAEFGYLDVIEMLEWRNVPVVKPDEDILMCIIDSEFHTIHRLMIMHTSSRVEHFCITPMGFAETDKDKDATDWLVMTRGKCFERLCEYTKRQKEREQAGIYGD